MWSFGDARSALARSPFAHDGGAGFAITTDGSFIEAPVTGNTGAAAGSVKNAYGTWTLGDLFASVPHYGGGQFYTPLLNGKPCNPAYLCAWAQSFEVDFGGNLYSLFTGINFG